MLLQVLCAVILDFDLISCQYQQQHFPSPAQYQSNQNHPTGRPQEHHDYHPSTHSNLVNYKFQPTPVPFDFDKFNQQAKQLQAQVHYFNQQQQKHIEEHIKNVHHDRPEPHFDFAVNGNYSDLENASEQFVNLGNLVDKQKNLPKVIKITKTVAIKQQVPMPYPVPVDVMKEQNSYDYSHQSQQIHQHAPATVEKPSSFKPAEFYNYTSYINKYQTEAPTPSESYRIQPSATTSEEFDTAPFYVTTPQKETIKIVPVPYYVDEKGNKHEVSSHASSSHDVDSEAFYPSRHTSSSTDGSGKFQTFSFSYHPPPTPNTYQSHSPQYSQQPHSSIPETKYFYNHDSDKSASSDSKPHYATEHNGEQQQQQYQYKYVTYE